MSERMMVLRSKQVLELESQLPRLQQERDLSALANDISEATVYWCHLGRWVLEGNTKVNFPERVKGEKHLLAKLRAVLKGKTLTEQHRYSPPLEAGAKILKHVETVQPPKDGHLGCLRIVRERFRFLQHEYGFEVVSQEP